MTLRTLNYGDYGIFLIMGHAGFCPSAVPRGSYPTPFLLEGAGDLVSRVIIRVTPFRALITLLITYLLSPLPFQVGYLVLWLGSAILKTRRPKKEVGYEPLGTA